MDGRKRRRDSSQKAAALPVAEVSDAGAANEAAYAAWLRSRGVTWHSGVHTTREGVVAGWGVVATKRLERGEILFSIPRGACLGACAVRAATVPPAKDTQLPLAKVLHTF